MNYKRKNKNKKINLILMVVILVIILIFSAVVAVFSNKNANKTNSAASQAPNASQSIIVPASSVSGAPLNEALPQTNALASKTSAMWVSFLEWEKADISSEAAMRSVASEMFDGCKAMGLNTVFVAVRAFSDALYESEYYPWSHLLTGTQGQNPGYDPLAVLIEEAHARDLKIEAWINPFRVNGTSNGPKELSENNPAAQNPNWVFNINGAWLNPGLPEVQELVANGAREIVQNYDVDGIHFDDYFYPEFNAEQKEEELHIKIDAETFEKYGEGKTLEEWRRNNVNTLVKKVYGAVKSVNPEITFGISPQGNNQNNYDIQFSDVAFWMANEGYIDYVMPQLYWGFNYESASGKTTYAFKNVSSEWAALPRLDSVKLYAGLGAYRIGAGDGGAGDQTEWSTGRNLADMVQHLNTMPDYSGFALFRYAFLFENENPLGAAETQALAEILLPQHAVDSSAVAETQSKSEVI